MNKVVSLIKDHELPPIMREIVENAPKNRKVAAFIATVSPLCAMSSRVRLKYYYDTRLSALLLQVLIEGAQSSGKSFAADIEGLIMNDTLKARDKGRSVRICTKGCSATRLRSGCLRRSWRK